MTVTSLFSSIPLKKRKEGRFPSLGIYSASEELGMTDKRRQRTAADSELRWQWPQISMRLVFNYTTWRRIAIRYDDDSKRGRRDPLTRDDDGTHSYFSCVRDPVGRSDHDCCPASVGGGDFPPVILPLTRIQRWCRLRPRMR